MKNHIEATFIKKASHGDGILFNDIVDLDGCGAKDKPVVSAIGGFIGQLVLVLNTIAKHYKKYDTPSKSRASSRHQDSKSELRPKTGDSGKEGSSVAAAPEEHQILNVVKI